MKTITVVIAVCLSLAGTARADDPATTAPPSPATEAAPQKIELFPAAALAPIAAQTSSSLPGTRARGKEESSPALRFDTGSGWGELAFSGALVGAFGALVALCKGGACMLK